MAEQLHASLTSPSAMPNVGWSGVKHAATGLWSSGNICRGETNHASLFGGLMGESVTCPCLFQHDCSPVHTERFIKTWLDEFDVEELDWIPQSPDLNLIEHLWDELKWKLQDRPSTSLPDLTNALLDKWTKITTKTLQNLVEIYLNLDLKYNLNLKGHMTLLCMCVLAVLQWLWKLFIQSDFTAVTVQQKINCGLLSFGRVQTHTVSYV